MDIQSDFALLDVKDGRRDLVKRLKNGGTIEVVIKGSVISEWGDDDGISQEFEVKVTEVKEVIKRKATTKKPKEFPTPWALPKKRPQSWYHTKAKRQGPLAEVTYENGVKIRMSFWSQFGKPLDWDRAARLCNSAYFLRYDIENEMMSLPQIVSMRELKTGEEFFPPRPNNQRSIEEYRGS